MIIQAVTESGILCLLALARDFERVDFEVLVLNLSHRVRDHPFGPYSENRSVQNKLQS